MSVPRFNNTTVNVLWFALLSTIACGDSRPQGSDASGGTVDGLVMLEPLPLGQPDTTLGMIRDMAVGDSVTWVVASGDIPLAIYSRDGTTRTYPLTKGEGPDQAQYVASAELDTNDAILVWDGMLGRIIRVDPAGHVTIVYSNGAFQLTSGSPRWDFLGGEINQLTSLSTGVFASILTENRNGSGDLSKSVIIKVATDTVETRYAFQVLDRWLDSASAGRRLFAPFPIWDRCDRDHVAILEPLRGEVVVTDANWQPVRTIVVGEGFRARTDSLAKVFFYHRLLGSTAGGVPTEKILQLVWGAPPEALHEASPVSPTFVDLHCTENGTVLLQEYEGTLERHPRSSEWLSYSPDGRVRRMRFPESFALLDATDAGLFGVTWDSLDVPTLSVAAWP